MTSRDFGAVVAPENKSVRRQQEMILDTDIDQFKYYKTILLKRVVPTGSATLTVSYPHGLTYLPAFETFLKGNKGTWGKILRGAQSAGIGSHAEFPYFGTEYVDSLNYNCSLACSDPAIAAHEVIIRLTLFYDEAFA